MSAVVSFICLFVAF
ncbi:hypothetical protein NGA_0396800, partial [Nannochloropsis gaditana CCMP526]